MNKPTEQEFLTALETIRAYMPGRFLNITQDAEHKFGHSDGLFLITHDKYFQLASNITGEVLPCNVFIRVHDEASKGLTAVAKFEIQAGKVIEKANF